MDNSTNRASLNVNVPQCYNGFLISDAKGYGETRAVISTNEETNAEIILQKEYTLPLEVYVDGAITNENAVLMMYSVDGNQTSFVDSVSYPAMKEVKLKQGAYSFELKVYKNGNVVIPATSTRQCLNQPQEGLLGILGMEEEKCYDLTVPGQTLTNVLYAGGSSNSFYTDDVLGSASAFRVSASSVKLPSTLEEVQISSDAVENKKIEVSLI
jgi:hypothetical protein